MPIIRRFPSLGCWKRSIRASRAPRTWQRTASIAQTTPARLGAPAVSPRVDTEHREDPCGIRRKRWGLHGHCQRTPARIPGMRQGRTTAASLAESAGGRAGGKLAAAAGPLRHQRSWRRWIGPGRVQHRWRRGSRTTRGREGRRRKVAGATRTANSAQAWGRLAARWCRAATRPPLPAGFSRVRQYTVSQSPVGCNREHALFVTDHKDSSAKRAAGPRCSALSRHTTVHRSRPFNAIHRKETG